MATKAPFAPSITLRSRITKSLSTVMLQNARSLSFLTLTSFTRTSVISTFSAPFPVDPLDPSIRTVTRAGPGITRASAGRPIGGRSGLGLALDHVDVSSHPLPEAGPDLPGLLPAAADAEYRRAAPRHQRG